VAALLAGHAGGLLVLADLEEIETLLRRSADLVLTTTDPLPEPADRLIERYSA
jgi:hypothetical protein